MEQVVWLYELLEGLKDVHYICIFIYLSSFFMHFTPRAISTQAVTEGTEQE